MKVQKKLKPEELKADIMAAVQISIRKAIIRCLEAIRETPENNSTNAVAWHTLTFGDEKDTVVYRRLMELESLGLVTKEVSTDKKYDIKKTKWKPTELGAEVLRTDCSSLLFRREAT